MSFLDKWSDGTPNVSSPIAVQAVDGPFVLFANELPLVKFKIIIRSYL